MILVLAYSVHFVEYNSLQFRNFYLHKYMLFNIIYAYVGKHWHFYMYIHHVQTSKPQQLIKILMRYLCYLIDYTLENTTQGYIEPFH